MGQLLGTCDFFRQGVTLVVEMSFGVVSKCGVLFRRSSFMPGRIFYVNRLKLRV